MGGRFARSGRDSRLAAPALVGRSFGGFIVGPYLVKYGREPFSGRT